MTELTQEEIALMLGNLMLENMALRKALDLKAKAETNGQPPVEDAAEAART